MHMFASLACAAVLALASPPPTTGTITWDKDWEQAKGRAAGEKRVLFVAVNMDGEEANDRMAQKVYSDARVVAAAALTVNVVASRFDHAPDKRSCTRFAGLECIDHKRIDGAVRQNVLKADANGYVVAPQHVFLGPDGAVLLSVPYEITAEELQWCFAAAVKAVDPEAARAIPTTGRPPRRLVQAGVFDPAALPGSNLAPPTRDQTLELIKELRGSLWGEGRQEKILRVLMSPEPEAVEYIGTELKNDLIGRRGWIRGMPGSEAGRDPKDLMMHAIGVFSPPIYWKLVSEYLDHEDEKLRNEAVVALEQLAVPESVKAILSALAKEKSPKVKKDLMRALGSAGASDDKARKALLKSVGAEKDETVRMNAIVALGWLAPGADVNKTLSELLASARPEERRAAAVAMGLSRNEAWIDFLDKANAKDDDPGFKACAEAALQVLKGAALSALRASVRGVCDDGLEREKFFGPAS